MKKIGYLFLAITLVSITIFSCTEKEDEPDNTGISLEITVKNALDSVVNGCYIKLYKSETDWQNEQNSVNNKVATDATGTVTIENLEAINYWIEAKKGNMNNFDGVTKTSKALSNGVNKQTVVVK